MEKLTWSAIWKNLKKNALLLLSAAAALCLFSSPTKMILLAVLGVFAVLVVLAAADWLRPPQLTGRVCRAVPVLIALLLAYMGFSGFADEWMVSANAAALAKALHLPQHRMLMCIALAAAAAGLYAFYVLGQWITAWAAGRLRDVCPVQQPPAMLDNLKRNWYFPLSALLFFCLNLRVNPGYLLSLLLAVCAALGAATQFPSLLRFSRQQRLWQRILSLLTAAGICRVVQKTFPTYWRYSKPAKAVADQLPIRPELLPEWVLIAAAAAAMIFVYFCLLLFWRALTRLVKDHGIFRGITKAEYAAYALLLAATLALMVFSFSRSDAFYGASHGYNIIYTSDSAELLKNNVYLLLTHPENDIRQPLFAVFAAPFMGLPCLIAELFQASARTQAMLMDAVQILLLFAGHFMLARMLKLSPIRRACFVTLLCCTYTHLLFTLMMEQYIVGYFWLTLCLYLMVERRSPSRFAFVGTAGTLVTGLVLLPFMPKHSPVRAFRAWLGDLLGRAMEFVAMVTAFCRFDVIFGMNAALTKLNRFASSKLKLTEKLEQYTVFVRSCLLAPAADADAVTFENLSWQLDLTNGFCLAGLGILAAVLVSAILNRRDRASRTAGLWCVFSVLVLVVLGWGTAENGLILYALYFGWAFVVLLFRLAEKLAERLRAGWLVQVLTAAAATLLLAVNLPGIAEMLRFAFTYYPG